MEFGCRDEHVFDACALFCCPCSYASCSLVKYMEKHKVKADSKAFLLVRRPPPSRALAAIVADGTRTAGSLFWTLNLRHKLVAFRCALAARAHSRLTRRRSIAEGRKRTLDAGQPKDFSAVLIPSPTVDDSQRDETEARRQG